MELKPGTQSSASKNSGQFTFDPAKNPAKSKSILSQPPAVSLPKGGGAIKNIDEKFQVNSSNGTASFSIPFPITPGRNEFNPAIALSYNSGVGNSSYGLGWSLDLPSIQRRTEKKYPIYRDKEDVFQFSGVEDLVPSIKPSQNPHSIIYHPRIEGNFSRIEKFNEDGNIYWKVTDKNNVISVFGKDPLYKISDPADATRIFKWLLQYAYDDKGNVIKYEYKEEDFVNVERRIFEKNRTEKNVTNRYPRRILYGNDEMFPAQQSDLNKITFRFEVAFVYERPDDIHSSKTDLWKCRLDPFSDYRSGFDIRNYRLCWRILMIHHFEEELGIKDYLVKSMDLDYDESKRFTYLKSATIRGYIWKDGRYESQEYPPLTFQYHKANFHTEIKEVGREDIPHAPVGIDNTNFQWADFKGTGISGLLTEQVGQLFFMENLGNGKFTHARAIVPQPSFSGLSNGTLQLQDIESNGTKSLVYQDENIWGYFDLNSDAICQQFKSFKTRPRINLRDPNIKLIDLNGDGMADILITEDHVFRWYPSKGKIGYDEPSLVAKPLDEEKGPAIVFADSTQSIVLSDMSGDGMVDIIRIRNGEVCYWPNKGYGNFGEKVTMANSPWFDSSESFNPKYLKLADIDGSGTPDIVYLGKNEFRVWFNESGNSWSASEIILNPFPSVDNDSNIDVVDFLGIGTSCVVWSSPLPKHVNAPIKYIDLFAGKKPHVMHTYSNNLGKEITIHYKSSVQYYLDDKKKGIEWITKLPFPVQCVEKVEVRDFVSQTRFTSSYNYSHGYHDSVANEFRGFARVEQTDCEGYKDFVYGTKAVGATNEIDPELFQEPVKTITWYHTGAYLQERKILHQLVSEYYDQKQHLPEPIFPGNLTTEELIEAHRVLKGLVLRQEVYSLDENSNRKKLYTVSESNYLIQLLQAKDGNQHAVFFPYESEKVIFNIEGNPDDPRIAHTLNLEIDKYGMVKHSASIVYGRKAVEAHPEQKKHFITCSTADFIHLDSSPDHLRLGLPHEK
jgi:hypothetical protein